MTEAKLRQYVRRELLREDYGAYMSAQDLYDIFDSIKDVWEVTKVAIKDVLSAAVYVYDVAVAVNGEEIEKARNRYKVDKDKIIDEYAGALKSVQDRMGKDFHMVAFLAAPGPYLLAQTYDKGPQVTKDIVKFLAEAGMDFEMPGKSAKGDPEGTDTGIQQGAYDAIYGKKSNYTQAQFTNLSGQIETALNKIFGVRSTTTEGVSGIRSLLKEEKASSDIEKVFKKAQDDLAKSLEKSLESFDMSKVVNPADQKKLLDTSCSQIPLFVNGCS